jgi:hypothetical protein
MRVNLAAMDWSTGQIGWNKTKPCESIWRPWIGQLDKAGQRVKNRKQTLIRNYLPPKKSLSTEVVAYTRKIMNMKFDFFVIDEVTN